MWLRGLSACGLEEIQNNALYEDNLGPPGGTLCPVISLKDVSSPTPSPVLRGKLTDTQTRHLWVLTPAQDNPSKCLPNIPPKGGGPFHVS